MRLIKYGTLVVLVLIFTGLIRPLSTQAQADVDLVVEHTNVAEGNDTIALDAYFSVQDKNGRSLPNPDVESPVLVMETGERYNTTLSESPIYIALVLDASGSMDKVAENVRQRAQEVADAAPPQAHIAVMGFNEQINLIQPFTTDRDLVAAAIASYTTENRGTCLYDVTYTAVEALNQISQNTTRRAVFLFTDGRDEKTQGLGNTCSQNTFDQVIALANSTQKSVPIYTISFAGGARPKEQELEDMSLATGGLAANGKADTLADTFQQAMKNLQGLWVAHADIYAAKGTNVSALYAFLPGENVANASNPIIFRASRDFLSPQAAPTATPPPPIPFTVAINNFRYLEDKDVFEFTVDLTRASDIGNFTVEVWDNDSNVQVNMINIPLPLPSQPVELSTETLVAGKEYFLKVTPFDLYGSYVPGENTDILYTQHTFRYTPPVLPDPIISIRTVIYNSEKSELTIKWSVENPEQVASYVGYLTAPSQGQLPFVPVAGQDIVIPIQLTSNQYSIVINAISADNVYLAGDQYGLVNYVRPGNIIVRTARFVVENPWLLPIFILFVIAEAIIVKLIADRLRPIPVAATVTAVAPTKVKTVRLRMDSTPDNKFSKGQEIPLTEFPFVIGRGEGCNLVIDGDFHISRKHSEISFENGVYYLRDFYSSNGTFVNNEQVPSDSKIPLSLERPLTIRVGRTTYLTFAEEQAFATAPLAKPTADPVPA